jgi:acyl carrier protein
MYCTFSVLMKRQTRPGATDASVLARVVAPNVIGRPIWNAECHILDAYLRPVPIGVVGELCIGGTPVARGYLNDPALTARKFVSDFFGRDEATRLYRSAISPTTCPMATWSFLGRMDHQIKVRGVRIEPQGVEAVLNRYPEVAESLVRGIEGPDGEKHLVAYVAIPPEGTDAREPGLTRRLRTHLERTLPRFMVPGLVRASGETAPYVARETRRCRLAPPDFGRASSKPSFVAPRNEVEEALAQIWKQVLHLERIGIHDDFLDHGGDSMSAIRMVAHVNRAFGVALSLRAFFDVPTIASLAAHLASFPVKKTLLD